MLKRTHSKITKQPEYVSLFAVFVRHASAREKKKVFEQVMKIATEKQRKLMESARTESKYIERKEA